MRPVGMLKMRRKAAILSLALAIVSLGAPAASAQDPLAETNIVERVECLFRVYVTEGGENGLDCLT
jgi:hypothetical protein